MIAKAHVQFEAGLLCWTPVRDFLEECKWQGLNIEWREGRGWISRVFSIRGDANDVKKVAVSLDQWATKLEEAKP